MLMKMCWFIIPLLGFTQSVNTFQVSNITDAIKTSVVVVHHKTVNSTTNTNFINKNVPKTTATVYSESKASSSLAMTNKTGVSKTVSLTKTIVQNLNKSTIRSTTSLNMQSSSTSKVISATKSFPSSNISRTSPPAVSISNVTKNSTPGSNSILTKKTISVSTTSVGEPIKSTLLNTTSKPTNAKKVSQNITIHPTTQSLKLVNSSIKITSSSSHVHVVIIMKNSSHIADKKKLATASPNSTGVPKAISTKSINKTITNGIGISPTVSSTPLSRSSPIKVVNKSNKSMISTQSSKISTSLKPSISNLSNSSKISTSSMSTVIVLDTIAKVNASQASSSSKLVISSSKIVPTSSSVHIKINSTKINITHATSNISKATIHSSSSVVKVTHLPSTSKIVLSSTPKPSSSVTATVVISTTSLAVTPKIVVISSTHTPVSSSKTTVASLGKSIVRSPVKSDLPSTKSPIASTPMSSSYNKKSTYVITSAISPTSSVQEKLQTKVVLPGFSTGSHKVPLTLAGRIGIGVAIAAGIIIIVLLIYFAKSKHKINRYRRYDNTYQIPGFTDVGGMVQLSTIGDSEYEILDATDYSRGDNPLYDLAQNAELHTPYENHGYARNEYDGSNDTGNANNTNYTNFPTFKE